METVKLDSLESLVVHQSSDAQWKVAYRLFTNVMNSSHIHKSLIEGEIQAALLNPSLIADIFQVTVAANRALRSNLLNKMSTRSLYTEIIFNMSPTKKIAQSLKAFGINDKSTSLLAVILSSTEPTFIDIDEKIDGEATPLENLGSLFDENAFIKLYKVSAEERRLASLLDCALGRMACKEFL